VLGGTRAKLSLNNDDMKHHAVSVKTENYPFTEIYYKEINYTDKLLKYEDKQCQPPHMSVGTVGRELICFP